MPQHEQEDSRPVGLGLRMMSRDMDSSHMAFQINTEPNTTGHDEPSPSKPLPPVVVQKKFQATVEDESDSSSVIRERCSSSSPKGKTPRPYNGTFTPPSSRDSSPKHRPSVHFSTRHPVVLHHRSNSSSEEDACREDILAEENTSFCSADRRIWGVLFTEHGEPTRRLGQVLRGLANYIIREYEPSTSIVIPPSKLYAFYRRYKLDRELFPFQSILDFHSRHCLRSLELLYQDLSCEYHLIQDHHRTRPFIPALTPSGLQTWLTTFIQASPDAEALRLCHILRDIPLETDTSLSPSGTQPEILPSYLPRHLFPAQKNERVKCTVLDALDDWHKRMGSASEPSTPTTWSSVLYDALGGGVSTTSSSARKEKSCTEHKRHISRRDDSVSSANTSRPRLRQREKYPPQTEPRKRDSYLGRLKVRDKREVSPLRQRYSERNHKTEWEARELEGRRYKRSEALRCPARPVQVDLGAVTPDMSPTRAESYRFFQGRGPGPTYDEFWRGKGRMSCG